MMGAFRLLQVRLRWILYSTHLWNPMRDKLLDDHKRGKFVMTDGTTQQQQQPQQNQEVTVRVATGDGPEVGINQWPLARIGYWARFYYRLSTLTIVWNFISISILIYKGNLTGHETNIDENEFSLLCHLPRVAIPEVFDYTVINYTVYPATILHLLWRFIVSYSESELILNPIVFLLIDDAKYEKLAQDTQNVAAIYRQYGTLELTQRIMFYKVEDNLHNLVEFHIRPNRSPEARAKLSRIVDQGSSITNSIIVSVTSSFLLAFAYTLLMTPQVSYAGCNVELFDLAHIYRFIGTLIVTIILIFDTITTLTYPIFVAYIMIDDLMLYWERIQSMLAGHLKMMRQQSALNDRYIRHDARSQSHCYHHNLIDHTYRDANASNFSSREWRARAIIYDPKIFDKTEEPALEAGSLEIQSIVADFFAQLEEADHYVSLIIAWVFCVWLAIVAVVFLMGLRTGTNLATTIFIRSIQLTSLLILLLVTALTLKLKRATEPAYGTICSIMAHDQSIEKSRWVSLLKYYTGRHPKYAFTIAHSKLYTLGIFLENFSYTFTFGLYLQTFGYFNVT